MHGLIFLRERGHILAMYWRYIIDANLTLCYSSSIVYAGLWLSGRSHGGRECSLCSILLQRLSVTCWSLWCLVLFPFLCICGFILCKSLLVSFALGLWPICNSTWPFSVACHCYAKLSFRYCWLCSFVVTGF